MPLMGFQKKKYLDRGVGGWVELYPNYFWIFGIFLTLQSPLHILAKFTCTDPQISTESGNCKTYKLNTAQLHIPTSLEPQTLCIVRISIVTHD